MSSAEEAVSSDSRASRSDVPSRSIRSTEARESRSSSSRRSSSAIDSWRRAACSSSSCGAAPAAPRAVAPALGPGRGRDGRAAAAGVSSFSWLVGARHLSSCRRRSHACRRTDPKPSSSERSAGPTRLRRSVGESPAVTSAGEGKAEASRNRYASYGRTGCKTPRSTDPRRRCRRSEDRARRGSPSTIRGCAPAIVASSTRSTSRATWS